MSVADRQQCFDALRRANDVRLARAALKKRIAAGTVTVSASILSAAWEIERMPVGELLLSQPHWGEVRCRRFLTSVRLSENKTIGSMTERQRSLLSEMLSAGDELSHVGS